MKDNRIELNQCCAFTGHRPHKFPWKYDEADERCIELKSVIAQQIDKLAATGVTDFFSGMALGVDVWAAMAVLDLRERNQAVKLHCVLPYEGQADRWSDSAQEQYHSILKRADSVEYVSRKYYDGCLLDRNHRLIESAGILLAVYNGERRGGTAATIRYAQKVGRKIICIDPKTLLIESIGAQR